MAEAIADVAFDVLNRIGDDPDARYAFFKRFVALAREVVRDHGNRAAEIYRHL